MIKSNISVGLKNKLALVFILYNEGKTIADVIELFHENNVPLYDYLIIGIDNKTEDDTYEQVKKYCPDSNIIHFAFNSDFANSRNIVLRMAEQTDAKWVFMPDGHEYLNKNSIEPLKYFIETADNIIHVGNALIGIHKDEYGNPGTIFPRPVLIRNKKKIFFERKVHNLIKVDAKHRVTIPEIKLMHDMPENRSKQRKEHRAIMNIPELKKNADAGDLRDLFYLGNTYSELGQIDNAIETYEDCLLRADGDSDTASQTAIYLASIYMHKKKDYKKAKQICYIGLKNRWDRAELYCYLATMAGMRAKVINDVNNSGYIKLWQQAEHFFKVATLLPTPLTSYFLDMKYYTWVPWEGLMDAYAALNEPEKALLAAKAVLKYKPDAVYIRQNIIVLENHAQGIKLGNKDKEKYEDVNVNTDPFLVAN